jgi:hypothetical protein
MFGQLLVKRQLITQEQLDRAIARQHQTGQRLGEICAEWDIITHEHVRDILRTQHNARVAAAIAVALLSPLEGMAAEVLPALEVSTPVTLSQEQSGMRVLTEEQLAGTSAQGLSPALVAQVKQHTTVNGVQVIGDMAKLVNPLLNFLDADAGMKNVVYDQNHASAAIHPDGSMTLRLPTSIGEVNFNNVRVAGTDGPNFGSIAIHGVDLSNTVVTMNFHH